MNQKIKDKLIEYLNEDTFDLDKSLLSKKELNFINKYFICENPIHSSLPTIILDFYNNQFEYYYSKHCHPQYNTDFRKILNCSFKYKLK